MSYRPVPSDPTPPDTQQAQQAARPGVFAFRIGDRTLHADSAKAFVMLQDRVDELNALLIDLQGGLPTTPATCESWTKIAALGRQVFGLPQLALDGSGASDTEVLSTLLQFFSFAGLCAPSPAPHDPMAN